jgi:hypothetical protein
MVVDPFENGNSSIATEGMDIFQMPGANLLTQTCIVQTAQRREGIGSQGLTNERTERTFEHRQCLPPHKHFVSGEGFMASSGFREISSCFFFSPLLGRPGLEICVGFFPSDILSTEP